MRNIFSIQGYLRAYRPYRGKHPTDQPDLTAYFAFLGEWTHLWEAGFAQVLVFGTREGKYVVWKKKVLNWLNLINKLVPGWRLKVLALSFLPHKIGNSYLSHTHLSLRWLESQDRVWEKKEKTSFAALSSAAWVDSSVSSLSPRSDGLSFLPPLLLL